MDIDLGDAYDFVDEDGKPYKLRFRRNWAPRNDPRIFDGTGQLIAVVADVTRPDNHPEIAISRIVEKHGDVERSAPEWCIPSATLLPSQAASASGTASLPAAACHRYTVTFHIQIF